MAISRAIDYYSESTQNRVYRSVSAPAGWSDAKYRVITSRAPFPEDFLNWLTTWATKVVGGTWVLNSEANTYTSMNLSAEFISNGQLFYGLTYTNDSLYYQIDSDMSQNELVAILNSNGKMQFNNEAHRTLIFLEPPTDNLLTWLNANGVKQ